MGYWENLSYNLREEWSWTSSKRSFVDDIPEERELIEEDSKGNGKYWAIFTTGAGLFSDGYVNNSAGSINAILSTLYPVEYVKFKSNVNGIVFAGTIIGQIGGGILADYVSRKFIMLAAAAIMVLFSILMSGAWGAGGSISGLFAAIIAYRFFLGIGIGAEYLSSVPAAEASNALPKGNRNRYFALFTNFMIDFGFVMSAFVTMVLLWICKAPPTGADSQTVYNHLTPVWRVTVGIGAIFPLALFLMRLKYKEPATFKLHSMRHTKIPYILVIKYYWWRIAVVGAIWFLYDFSVYAFGIYATPILNTVVTEGNLYQTQGWNVVINLFYIPGAFLGSFAADYFGPRITLVIGLVLQAVVGYGMAAGYKHLTEHVAGFAVVYGIFLSFGEFGPGDNVGLIASKSCASAVKGQFYGIVAALGKTGALVGTYVFPKIIANNGGSDSIKGNQAPFWVASSLCLFSAALGFFCLPALYQDAPIEEDWKFRDYLSKNGWDVSKMGETPIDGRPHVVGSDESGKVDVPNDEKL